MKPSSTIRFGVNPQAYALKQAFAKREKAIAHKKAYQAALESYSKTTDQIQLADEILKKTAPGCPEGEALSTLIQQRFWHHGTNPKGILLHMRKSIAAQSAPPAPNTGASQLIQNLINQVKREKLNATDLDGYQPVFNEQDETLFLKTLKEMIETDLQNQYRSKLGNIPYSAVNSIPLLVDIIDYALSNPPRNEVLSKPENLEVFTKPLREMIEYGAVPLSLSKDQDTALSKIDTAQAILDRFEKKGYFQEDGVKLLPEPLVKSLCESIAVPETV